MNMRRRQANRLVAAAALVGKDDLIRLEPGQLRVASRGSSMKLPPDSGVTARKSRSSKVRSRLVRKR